MRPPMFPLLPVATLLACAERPTAEDRSGPNPLGAQAPSSAGSAAAVPGPAGAAPRSPAERADDFYARRCLACHGATGGGDGPGAALIKPPPRSLADVKWQKTVRDADIAAIIVKGGAALNKSRAMPASPELAKDAELRDALVAKVRSFGK